MCTLALLYAVLIWTQSIAEAPAALPAAGQTERTQAAPPRQRRRSLRHRAQLAPAYAGRVTSSRITR